MGEWLQWLILPGFRPAEYAYAECVESCSRAARKWLEAGCGRSVLPEWMKDAAAPRFEGVDELVGLDANEDSLRQNQQLRMRVVGSVEALPFQAGWFDLVTARFVMEHVENPAKALAEVERVLAPGGVFLAHTPNRGSHMVRLAYLVPQRWKNWIIHWLEGRASEDVFRVFYRFNTRQDVECAAAEHGLAVEEIRFEDGAVETLALGPLAILELLFMRLTRLVGRSDWRSTMVVRLRKPRVREHRSTPWVSVVVPALNEEAVIGTCLESLARQSMPRDQFEVIVVDNGSTDDTEGVAKSFRDRLTLSVLRKTGAPVSAVRNRGADVARGEYLAFLDADCVAGRDWLKLACTSLDGQPDTVLGAFYRVPKGCPWTPQAWYGDQYWLRSGNVSYVPASNLFLRRTAFLALGGFDEGIATSEDCEFCHRARRSGVRVAALPGLSVVHLGYPRRFRDFFWKQLWQGGDVPKLWRRDVRHGPGLGTMVFALWTMIAVALAVAGLLLWAGTGDSRAVLAGIVAAPAASTVAAARASWRRGKLRVFVPLIPLYFAYGLARGLTLLGVRCPRGSARIAVEVTPRAARPGG